MRLTVDAIEELLAKWNNPPLTVEYYYRCGSYCPLGLYCMDKDPTVLLERFEEEVDAQLSKIAGELFSNYYLCGFTDAIDGERRNSSNMSVDYKNGYEDGLAIKEKFYNET